MEESQEILLSSLESYGVLIPTNVSSIRDLTPTSLFSICAQVLNLMDETKKRFSTSLPDSVADQFKICSEIASTIKDLGFIGEMNFHKFLYPSEEDLYKLIRFLVERLSKPSDGKYYVLEDEVGRRILKAKNFECSVEDQSEKVDPDDSVFLHHKVKNEFADLNIISEETDCSSSTISRPSNSHISEQGMGEVAMDATANPGEQKFSYLGLVKASKDADIEASRREVVVSRGNDGCGSVFRHDEAEAHVQKTCEINTETRQFQDPESKLVEGVTAKVSELQHLQVELEMLKKAVRMAFDVNHPVEYHLQQLEEQINSRKHNFLAVKSQWDAEREILEKKRQSLQELLCESNPEYREKLQKLTEVELEKELIETEIRRREEEHSNLSTELEKQPKQASRRSYVNRVKEITKNSRKQDADIDRILKETRELQLESNIIQERLHRTYAVVDELVLREVKKDVKGREAHKLLTNIHENFEQISDKILATDRLRREGEEYEKKTAALASRSLNFDKLQADLDAIKRENDYLEQHLQHKKPVDSQV